MNRYQLPQTNPRNAPHLAQRAVHTGGQDSRCDKQAAVVVGRLLAVDNTCDGPW